MVDWYRRWSKGTESTKSDARSHFVGKQLTDGILPSGIETRLGISFKTQEAG
jgi:hypothetical protein